MTDDRPRGAFGEACALLEAILSGDARSRLLDDLRSASFGKALLRLREAMRSNVFPGMRLDDVVRGFDARNRRDGFHVLHDWDGKADRLNENTIPVEVVDFVAAGAAPERDERKVLAVLLDYYFFYVLALASLRVWDDGDPNDNLERLTLLLAHLQGPGGSGHKLVESAEALIAVGTSHFEPDPSGYDRLLEKMKALDETHGARAARIYAAVLASHLRFGFEATYGRDVLAMREDNAPDYPWLSFALWRLMKAYAAARERGSDAPGREPLVEGLLNGLTPDPRAFVGVPPSSLAAREGELSELRDLFHRWWPDLSEEFERLRPVEGTYSPLCFFFNFTHNLVKGSVVDGLLRGEVWSLGLEDLLTGIPRRAEISASKERLATTLMGYARSSPDTIRGRLVPAIVYDFRKGIRAFRDTVRRLESR